jgi:hypothetical protein
MSVTDENGDEWFEAGDLECLKSDLEYHVNGAPTPEARARALAAIHAFIGAQNAHRSVVVTQFGTVTVSGQVVPHSGPEARRIS